MTLSSVPMPKIGELMEEGILVEWLVQVGDIVEERHLIAVIETDKVTVEIESPFAGVVVELRLNPGDKAPVGTALCIIEEP